MRLPIPAAGVGLVLRIVALQIPLSVSPVLFLIRFCERFSPDFADNVPNFFLRAANRGHPPAVAEDRAHARHFTGSSAVARFARTAEAAPFGFMRLNFQVL
jgi:hypothetical protein